MLSKTFDILTPLSKQHRISRPIADMKDFAVEPAKWVVLNDDGQVSNFLDTTKSPAVELCIGHAVKSGDKIASYEAHDTKVGRVTTIAKPGTRVFVTHGDLNLGVAGTTLTVEPDIIGMSVIIATTPGDEPAGKTESAPGADDGFKYVAYKWSVGSFEIEASPKGGDTVVGVITDEDKGNGIEIRLTEPKVI